MFYSNALANTISAINVGYIAKHKYVVLPINKYTQTVLIKFVDAGAIESFYVFKQGVCLYTKITLAYINGRPAITKIRAVSTGAKRYTVTLKHLVAFSSCEYAYVLLSTSHGILTLREAVGIRCGGMVIAAVVY